MLKVILITIIVAATVIWTTRANNSAESKCREEIEQELTEYVKLESWQQLFTRHLKFIVNQSGDIFNENKLLKSNKIIRIQYNVRINTIK